MKCRVYICTLILCVQTRVQYRTGNVNLRKKTHEIPIFSFNNRLPPTNLDPCSIGTFLVLHLLTDHVFPFRFSIRSKAESRAFQYHTHCVLLRFSIYVRDRGCLHFLFLCRELLFQPNNALLPCTSYRALREQFNLQSRSRCHSRLSRFVFYRNLNLLSLPILLAAWLTNFFWLTA